MSGTSRNNSRNAVVGARMGGAPENNGRNAVVGTWRGEVVKFHLSSKKSVNDCPDRLMLAVDSLDGITYNVVASKSNNLPYSLCLAEKLQ